MLILRTILLAVEALSSLFLVGLILIQKSKGGGFGSAFGGGAGESILGARAGNVLTKATIITASVFMVNTLFLTLMYSGQTGKSLVEQHLGPAAPPQPAPQQAAPAQVPAAPQTLPLEAPAVLPESAPVVMPESAPVVMPESAPVVMPESAPVAPVESEPMEIQPMETAPGAAAEEPAP